jgi:hypothetical protein
VKPVPPSVIAESEEIDFMSLCYDRMELTPPVISIDTIEGLPAIINSLYQCIEDLDGKYKILLEAMGVQIKKNKRLQNMVDELYYPFRTKGED